MTTIKTQMVERAEREARQKEAMEKIGNFFLGLLKGIGWILLFGTPIGIIAWLVKRAIQKYQAKEDELESLRQYKKESESKIRNAKNKADLVEREAERECSQMESSLNELRDRYNELEKRYDDART